MIPEKYISNHSYRVGILEKSSFLLLSDTSVPPPPLGTLDFQFLHSSEIRALGLGGNQHTSEPPPYPPYVRSLRMADREWTASPSSVTPWVFK